MKFGYHTLTWANAYKNYDIGQTIREIKESGFSGIEFMEPLSMLGNAAALKIMLEREGIEIVSLSLGLNMDPHNNSDVEEAQLRIDFAKEFGIQDLMLCGGWRGQDEPKIDSAYKILADKINACAAYSARFNINIAFHPHKDTIVETEKDIEKLLTFTDKFKLCPDIAHLTACGSDPVNVIERFKDIITYVHFKDWDVEKDDFVELGRGEVDIMKCLETLKNVGYDDWVVVELDHTTATPMESCGISAEYLKRAGVL
jgi:inosose dehydratase